MTTSTDAFAIQRSDDRAFFDHGWLTTRHSFSFAGYHDRQNEHWGALRVFNDDVVAPAKGFGTHPHRDMEILTYVLEGELEHRDSMGNSGVVRSGGVQYLSAGTGIAHSEYNHSAKHPVHFVQMWVLPHAEGLAPRYGQVDFSQTDRTDRWLTIASGRADIVAPIPLWQDAAAYVARIEHAELNHTFENDRFGYFFVASGAVSLNNERLEAGDAARVRGRFDLALRGSGDVPSEVVLWDVPDIGEHR